MFGVMTAEDRAVLPGRFPAPAISGDIPRAPGSYALVLELAQPLDVAIGCLGRVTLAPGCYVYLGSAQGPGGLRARIQRHLLPIKSLHWHIDYLTQHTMPVSVQWCLGPARLECTWCQVLLRNARASVPVPHFGSSDCHAGCPAHLLGLPEDLLTTELLGELT